MKYAVLNGFLIFTLFIGGCVTPPKFKTELRFDTGLVKSYTFELEKLKPLEPPFYAEYNLNGKQLVVVAAEHISAVKYPNLLEHPTLKTIEDVFASMRPEISIVEGIQPGNELNSQNIAKAESCKKSFYLEDCGESFFVINKARESGTSFLSGEPTEQGILKIISEQGYDKKDLVGFYLLRKIPQWKRQKNFKKAEVESLAKEQFDRYRKRIDPNFAFTFEEFKSWYSGRMSTPKDYTDFANNDPAPHGGLNATYVQKISNRVTYARDVTLLTRINESLAKHDRVLVVYGGSHFISIEPALTKAMGPPMIKKLY